MRASGCLPRPGVIGAHMTGMTAPSPRATPGPPRSERGTSVAIDASGLRRVTSGGAVLLDDVSLSIRPGEMVAIVGGSGAGKTTLLEALAGVQPATSGTVRFDGMDVYADLATFRSALGYVPQDDII